MNLRLAVLLAMLSVGASLAAAEPDAGKTLLSVQSVSCLFACEAARFPYVELEGADLATAVNAIRKTLGDFQILDRDDKYKVIVDEDLLKRNLAKLTIHEKDLTLLDFIALVAEQSGLHITLRERAVVIEEK